MQLKRILLGVAVAWAVLSALFVAWYLYQARSNATREASAAAGLSTDRPGRSARAPKELDRELAALLYRYFPKPLSQNFEEVFIRDYFQDRRGGFLLDVGANHFRSRSTTHYLDVALGWRGIAVDALAEYAADYARHRPRTKFFPAFVSDMSDERVDFFVDTRNPRQSTAHAGAAEKFKQTEEVRQLPTVTLDDLLDSEQVESIDLLSMDIELWEPKALAGFDIDRFKPKLVVIEWHPPVQVELERYFREHRYARIEKYSQWDGRNVYLIPEEDLPAFLAREPIVPLASN